MVVRAETSVPMYGWTNRFARVDNSYIEPYTNTEIAGLMPSPGWKTASRTTVYEKGQIIIGEKTISYSAILKPKLPTMSSYIHMSRTIIIIISLNGSRIGGKSVCFLALRAPDSGCLGLGRLPISQGLGERADPF